MAEPVTQVFSMPLAPSLGIMPLSSALSQLRILCVAGLLPTPRIISLRCAKLNLQTFAVSVPLIMHHLTRTAYSSKAFTSCHDLVSNLQPQMELRLLLNQRQIMRYSGITKAMSHVLHISFGRLILPVALINLDERKIERERRA